MNASTEGDTNDNGGDDGLSVDRKYQIAQHHIWTWIWGVHEAQRVILEPDPEQLPDVYIHWYVAALTNLRSSVEWAKSVADTDRDPDRSGKLQLALRHFDRAVPNLTREPRLHGHRRDHDIRSPRRTIDMAAPLAVRREDDSIRIGDFRLKVNGSADAANQLAMTALKAIDGSSPGGDP